MPIDAARYQRIKDRLRLWQWARLISFRRHCKALVRVGYAEAERRRIEAERRRLAELARLAELERLARARQPASTALGARAAGTLPAVRELSRLVEQQRQQTEKQNAQRYAEQQAFKQLCAQQQEETEKERYEQKVRSIRQIEIF